MARPKNADGQRTRQAILDAALDLFAERGFFGTSLRDIARTVGVRESALYNYFPSKDALFEALITADQDTKMERLSAALDEGADDPRVVLERLARLSLDDFASPRQQQLFRILMSDGLRLARAGRLNPTAPTCDGSPLPAGTMPRRRGRRAATSSCSRRAWGRRSSSRSSPPTDGMAGW